MSDESRPGDSQAPAHRVDVRLPDGADESGAELRLMLDQLPAVVWATDRELRIVSATGAGLAGLAPGRLSAGTDVESLGPTALAAHRWALDGEQVTCEVTWDGRALQVCVEPFRGADGAITGCLAVGLDITARKRAEDEMRQAHASLEGRVAERTAELESANRALRLEGQERERVQERLSFLAQTGGVLAASLDYGETLQSIACLAVPVLADWSAVQVVQDGDGGSELCELAVCHSDAAKEAALLDLRRRYPPRLDLAALRAGVPQLAPDVSQVWRAEYVRDADEAALLEAVGLGSAMTVPLIARGRFIGVLDLAMGVSGRRYGPEDVALAEDLARRAAQAIDNARLYREAQAAAEARDRALVEETRARREAEALAEDVKARGDQQAVVAALGQCALAGASIAELLDDATAYVARTLDVPIAAVLELDEAQGTLRLRSGVGLPAEPAGMTIDAGTGSHAGYALQSGGPAVVDDLGTETRFQVLPMLREMGVVSGVSVPVLGGERPLGVLAAYSPQPARFGQDDVHFLQAVAQVLGLTMAGRAAERELRDSQLRFKTLFDVLPVGLSIVDEELNVVDANRAQSDILGLSHEELLDGADSGQLRLLADGTPLPEDEWPRTRALRERRATRGEFAVVRRTGERVWVRVEAAPFPLPGMGAVVATSDISARKAAEREREAALEELARANAQLEAQAEELRGKADELATQAEQLGVQSEELIVQSAELESQNAELARIACELGVQRQQYQEIFYFAPDAYLVTDLNGKILEANQAAVELLGIAARYLAGKPLVTYLHAADRPAFRTQVSRLARNDAERVRLEARLTPRRGQELPASFEGGVARDADGKPAGLRWLVHDVSGYKQLEEELRRAHDELEQRVQDRTRELAESETRFRQMFERNWAIKLVADADTGLIVDANPAACRYYGYAPDQLKTMSLADLSVQPRKQVIAELRSAVRQERTYFVFQHRLASGDVRDVELYSSPITVDGRTLVFSIIHDITDRVQAYQVLEQRVAERTRELETLLEIAHHVALTPELEPRLGLIAEQLEEVVPYDGAIVWGIENERMVSLYSRGPDLQGQKERIALPLKEAVIGRQVMEGGQPMIISDVHADEPQARLFREAAGERFQTLYGRAHSWLAVPLVVEDRTIGILSLYSAEVGAYGPREAGLATAFGAQAALAMENERLTRRARELAALEERQRLARDLHDAVSQTLFSASLIAEVLPKVWERDQEAGRQSLADLHQLTRGALAEMRSLLLELRPAALLEVGLSDLLPQLADVVTGRSRIPVKLQLEPVGGLPTEVQVNLYRIAQEACSNVARHSNASCATISLRRLPRGDKREAAGIELSIADDGRGFDPAVVAPNSLGLDIMRERAAGIGAKLSIDSRSGEGTIVVAVWRGKILAGR